MQGAFPETHETFIGTYWGLVSTPCTAEIVESASAYVIVGPLFNDYNTVAFTLLLDESAHLAHAAFASPSNSTWALFEIWCAWPQQGKGP